MKQRFFPLIFVTFTFLLFCNLIGMIPYSFTLTSHFIITLGLSLSLFIGIFTFLSHRLQLKIILHLLIWMNSPLQFSLWRSSSRFVLSLKTLNPYVPPYHFFQQKGPMPCRPFFYSQNSSIQHQILKWGFCKLCIFLSIFKIVFYLTFNNLLICLQIQLSL